MVKVKFIVGCLLLVLSVCNSSFITRTHFDNDLTEEASETPIAEFTETPDVSSAEITTEENVSVAPEQNEAMELEYAPPTIDEVTILNETLSSELHIGSVFRLMMTVVTKWNDEFMERTSPMFKTLSTELGAELIDFIDNSQEANEVNVTDFKLVEVLPSKDSSDKVYVTFVVSSKNELNGKELSECISNRIMSHGGFYEHKATLEGFVLENITKEEAQDYEETKVACDLGEFN